MNVYKIDLYEFFGIDRGENLGGYLTCITHGNSPEINTNRLYPAMLVLPGGGYAFCSDREAEPIAEQYFVEGFNAFVLRYSVAPTSRYPVQLCEASMAMAYIRRTTEQTFTDKAHVAAVGFSAGGHLCGSLATMFADSIIKERTGICPEEVRPDAVVLSYAVISSELGTSGGTFNNLCGERQELFPVLSIEKRVTPSSSPMFIWHTVNDGCVNVSNALAVATAANNNGVPYALHIFEKGQHGLSLANQGVYHKVNMPEQVSTDAYKWFSLSVNWLKDRGFCYID